MSQFDDKINEHFSGLVVRKDLVKTVKGNAIVPSYVLEYLLGQYCASNDELTIQNGISTVKEILRKHYVHRNESGLVRSIIKEKGRHKVIDRISVALNEKKDAYEAEFANLGIKKVIIDSHTVKTHPKLLVSGVWCIADVEYDFSEEKDASPWILGSLKPIQLSHLDFDAYIQARRFFSTDEWIDLLIQSMGFEPSQFSKRNKFNQLVRLIPFCERNYNMIELGPKGTGKSHIYSEFSPHGILISGGEVTTPKLFVHNGTGKVGLVGYWDTIAFDEFAGKKKRVDKALVDIMKNYMANKTFSRGIETLGAEASMVFVGNTQHSVPHMLKHSDLFDELPESYHDSAFLDRIHFYIAGWEVDIIRGEMFSQGYGFVVDYLAEVLRALRSHDYSDRYKAYFTLSSDLSTRDRDAINKTFSGLMKILYPDGQASESDIQELLNFAMEGRKRVKDQLLRIDNTYSKVSFSYHNQRDEIHHITTKEEETYPNYYHKKSNTSDGAISESYQEDALFATPSTSITSDSATKIHDKVKENSELTEQQITWPEGKSGFSLSDCITPYLQQATEITISDLNIGLINQQENLLELLTTIANAKPSSQQSNVHLITTTDLFMEEQQESDLQHIAKACLDVGINLTWQFVPSTDIMQSFIQTNTGWKIQITQGLDVYQPIQSYDKFSLTTRLPQYRPCRVFEMNIVKYKEIE